MILFLKRKKTKLCDNWDKVERIRRMYKDGAERVDGAEVMFGALEQH